MQPCEKSPHLTNGRQTWEPLVDKELVCWLGIVILMGLKPLPNRRLYWDSLGFFGCELIQSCMSRNRFEAIGRCIHLVDNRGLPTDASHPEYDKIGKVRWLMEHFASTSQRLYNCERICTVDEIMVPYKGRYCNIQQYMKSKPTKYGIKIWALVSSGSRYVWNVIVYMGAGSNNDYEDVSGSVGEKAVLSAVNHIRDRGHVIVTDNFFTSPKLCMELMSRGFWTTGEWCTCI